MVKGGLFHSIPNYREDPTDAIAYHRLAVHLTSLQSRACSASKCWLKLLPKNAVPKYWPISNGQGSTLKKSLERKKKWSMDFPFFAHYYYLPKLFFAAVAAVKICLWKCPKLIFLSCPLVYFGAENPLC